MRTRTLIVLIVIVAALAGTAYASRQDGGRLRKFFQTLHGSAPGH